MLHSRDVNQTILSTNPLTTTTYYLPNACRLLAAASTTDYLYSEELNKVDGYTGVVTTLKNSWVTDGTAAAKVVVLDTNADVSGSEIYLLLK